VKAAHNSEAGRVLTEGH